MLVVCGVVKCANVKSSVNKIQSETADFVPGTAPGKLDETYSPSLILVHSLYYVKHDVIHKTGSA